jgi:uncharacterized protein (DUF1810 family)
MVHLSVACGPRAQCHGAALRYSRFGAGKAILGRSPACDRLRNDVRLMIRHKDKSALEILGSPNDLKFRSCLTLFRQPASEASDGRGTGLINEKWETLVG